MGVGTSSLDDYVGCLQYAPSWTPTTLKKLPEDKISLLTL